MKRLFSKNPVALRPGNPSKKHSLCILKRRSKALRLFVALSFLSNAVLGDVALAQYTSPDMYPSPTAVIEYDATVEEESLSTSGTVEGGDSFLYQGTLSAATEEEEIGTATTTGRAFYVSASGSNTDNGTQTSPWRSIQYAVNHLQAGDTLYILEGVYSEAVDMKSSGISTAYITIQGIGNVVIDGSSLPTFEPVFETKGHSFIKFQNLTVNNARSGVEVNPGSRYIEVDGLRTNSNHFAVKINGGQNIIVRNVVAANSRNGFRTEGTGTRDILFEDIEVYGSKDIYAGYESVYRNGDGFILETGTNITLRNILSYDHWDAGFDIKASNVLVEHVITYGNKNNFKTWGQNIVVKNSLIYAARYMPDDPVAGEGNGLNARSGSVTFINCTFADNDVYDIKMTSSATVRLENSIVSRHLSGGQLLTIDGGSFSHANNIWFHQGRSSVGAVGFTMPSDSRFADPLFVNRSARNYRLTSSSPAVNLGNNSFKIGTQDLDGNDRVAGENVDAGAYEFGSSGSTPPPPADQTPFEEKAGQVVMEGQSFFGTTTVNGQSWQVVNAPAGISLSGGQALMAGPDLGRNITSNITTSSPRADYKVYVNTPGTYYVWIRGYAKDGGSDSLHVGLNGQLVSGGTGVSGFIFDGSAASWTNRNMQGTRVSFTVTQPGEHTLNLWMREDGFLADKIVLTQNASFTPTGLGPAESGRLQPDTTPPVISGVASSNITSAQATIQWTTNEPADSQVEYRVKGTSAWQATSVSTSLVTGHSVVLTGLNAGTEYEYRVKSRDQAGNLAVQATVSSFKTLASQDAPFQMTEGQVVMEGQSFFGTTTVSGQSWQVVNAPAGISLSGGQALMAGPDLGRNITSNITTSSPRADYKINVTAPGTYYVWIRGYAKDGGSDSLHVGLNGQLVSGGTGVSGFIFDGSAASWTNRNMQGTRVSFTVTQPGEHTLNLWMREDGLLVDKIVITQDPAYVPAGLGPVESGRL